MHTIYKKVLINRFLEHLYRYSDKNAYGPVWNMFKFAYESSPTQYSHESICTGSYVSLSVWKNMIKTTSSIESLCSNAHIDLYVVTHSRQYWIPKLERINTVRSLALMDITEWIRPVGATVSMRDQNIARERGCLTPISRSRSRSRGAPSTLPQACRDQTTEAPSTRCEKFKRCACFCVCRISCYFLKF